jgi:hypothetical protein
MLRTQPMTYRLRVEGGPGGRRRSAGPAGTVGFQMMRIRNAMDVRRITTMAIATRRT